MSRNPRISTFILNTILASIGIYLGYEFGLFYLFPVLFSLGTPMINLKSDFLTKLKLTGVLVISITAVLLITTGFSFVFEFILIPVILSGLAGGITLWLFEILVDNVKPKLWLKILTILFCMLPLTIAYELVNNPAINLPTDLVFIFGVFGGWSVIVSAAISLSILRSPKLPASER